MKLLSECKICTRFSGMHGDFVRCCFDNSMIMLPAYNGNVECINGKDKINDTDIIKG